VVAFPFKQRSSRFFNVTMNKLSVGVLSFFAFSFYSFSLISSGVEEVETNRFACVTFEKYFDIVKAIATIDTLFTTFIPFILITASNIGIVVKLTRSENHVEQEIKLSPEKKLPNVNFNEPEQNDDSGESLFWFRLEFEKISDKTRQVLESKIKAVQSCSFLDEKWV
jgi:hypothetical protein